MRCIEVLGVGKIEANETEAVDAQFQSIKQREKALKVQKAQLNVNKALSKLNKERS
jgi:hypothetical protein